MQTIRIQIGKKILEFRNLQEKLENLKNERNKIHNVYLIESHSCLFVVNFIIQYLLIGVISKCHFLKLTYIHILNKN